VSCCFELDIAEGLFGHADKMIIHRRSLIDQCRSNSLMT
jgi:hypothetical protein